MPNLQDGIYWQSGSRPGACYAILFLSISERADARAVGSLLAALWHVVSEVRQGRIPDLPDHPVEREETTVLIGYGQRVFDIEGIKHDRPRRLRPKYQFREPHETGGGRLLLGSGLRYGEDVASNPATGEIALQIIGQTELDVHQIVVEVWKLLDDQRDPVGGEMLLSIVTYFRGFLRADRRTWIDFHDGISNIRKGEDRLRTIEIKSDAEPWTRGGTYMAYTRLAVDLASWRRLSRATQELLVGRDKLTGCPFAEIDADGRPYAVRGCPISGTSEVVDGGNEAFREPPYTDNGTLLLSHVQRANHHKRDFGRPDSLRLYRQGYDFLEPIDRAPGFRAGLNFVGFMDTPERLLRMLTADSWLGGVNFGGDPEHQPLGMERLLTVRAAGIYLVPPQIDTEPFPGASMFGVS